MESAGGGDYANTFGIGTSLLALPFYFGAYLIDADLISQPQYLYFTAKSVASFLMALATAILFCALTHVTSQGRALLLALAFAFGTPVFTMNSQALWQQTGAIFAVCAGLWLLLWHWTRESRALYFLSGLMFAVAALCRSTHLFSFAILALGLVWLKRRNVHFFLLGGVLPILLLLVYNEQNFGSVLNFGQLQSGKEVAMQKTGSPELWQTPLTTGLAGLLFSPSRGLMVYSPFFLFLLASLIVLAKGLASRLFYLPLFAATILFVIAAKWFDWWGGWSFGYRPVVDATPYLILLLVPILNKAWHRTVLRHSFVVTVLIAMAHQTVGFYTYRGFGWNDFRDPITGRAQDVDRPEHRHRLWSWTDNQILYHYSDFGSNRAEKKKLQRIFLDGNW
jgi:hypothetical protein